MNYRWLTSYDRNDHLPPPPKSNQKKILSKSLHKVLATVETNHLIRHTGTSNLEKRWGTKWSATARWSLTGTEWNRAISIIFKIASNLTLRPWKSSKTGGIHPADFPRSRGDSTIRVLNWSTSFTADHSHCHPNVTSRGLVLKALLLIT